MLIPWERIAASHRPVRELAARADGGGYLPAGQPCTRCGSPLGRPEELHLHLYSGLCRACVTAPPVLELVFRDGAMAVSYPDRSLDRRPLDPPARRTIITYPDCAACHGHGNPEHPARRCEPCWRRWRHGRWQHWYVTRRAQLFDLAYRRFLAELDQAAGVVAGATAAQRHQRHQTIPAGQAAAIRGRVAVVHARARRILDRWALARGVYGARVARVLDGGRRPPRLVTRRAGCRACGQASLVSSGASDDLAALPCPICRTPALVGGQLVQAAAGLDADERRRLPLRIARFDAELAACVHQRTSEHTTTTGDGAGDGGCLAGPPHSPWRYPWRLDPDLDADLLRPARRAARTTIAQEPRV